MQKGGSRSEKKGGPTKRKRRKGVALEKIPMWNFRTDIQKPGNEGNLENSRDSMRPPKEIVFRSTPESRGDGESR